MNKLLEMQGISKSFGGLQAVKNLSLDVSKGEILGIVGPNGAGKSTVLSIIAGNLKQDTGKVIFDGSDISDYDVKARVRAGIARTFQTPRLFWSLSCADNIGTLVTGNKTLLKAGDHESSQMQISGVGDIVGIDNEHLLKLANELDNLSVRKLELGMMLALQPSLFLIDEIFAGLTLQESGYVSKILRNIRNKSRAMVLVDHNLPALKGVVERIIVMHFGEKLAEGSPDEIFSNDLVKAAYLGSSKEA